MKKSWLLIFLLVLVSLTLFSCGDQPPVEKPPAPAPAAADDSYPLTLTDARGKEIILESAPQRIISLAPSVTEVLFALGLDDRIVAVTDNCDYPAAARTKESIGDYNVNLEKVVSLEPDLVVGIASMNGAHLQGLDELGVTTLAVDAFNLDETRELIVLLGQATGASSKAGEIIAAMDETIARVNRALDGMADSERKSVFIEIGYEPLYTVGPGSLQDEIIRLAGGVNAAQANEPWVQYSLEQLIQDDPDALVILSSPNPPALKEIAARPGWNTLTAVKEQKVATGFDVNTFVRPTPRVAEAVEQLARFLYPERF